MPLAPAAGFAAVLNRPADVRDTAVPHLRIGPPREEKKVEIFETVEEQSKSLHQDLPDFQDGPQRTSGSPRNVETAESDSSRILPQQVSESELADALNVDGVQGSPRTGVFWGNSPTSMRIRRELSNKIRATSTTQPTIPLDFKAAGESESSSKGAEPLLSSGEGRRSGLKRHLSFDNIFSSKNEGSSSSFLFQASKKTKRQHWTGQAEELAGSEAPAEVGGSKLSDMISKAQKLLTATPSRPVAQHSAAGTLSKRTRSPFERSASMSWIHQGRKSPLTTEPLMNVKLPPSQFNFDSDLGISIEDFENAIGKTEPTLQPKRQKYRRFVVLESEAGMREITLRVFDEVETQEAVVILRDSWLGTTVGIGDYINLVGDPEPVAGDGALKWIVNDTRNFLILHPDTLISSTQIAEIVNCVRKAVVDDRIKRAGDFNMAALLGTMMHELIQSSLKQGDLSDEFIARETVRIVADRIEQLYFLGQNEEVAKNHLADLTRSYKQWAASYLAEYPVSFEPTPRISCSSSLICFVSSVS